MESEESVLKKDELVQNLVDHYGDWFKEEGCENRAGGSGRMTQALYPYQIGRAHV